MTPQAELSRPVPVERIGAGGMTVEVDSTEAEREAVARRLGIEAVTALSCRFRLRRDAARAALVAAEGELAASVVQICVVTLEPFEAPLAERFRLMFVPAGQESEDDDPEADDEIPYEGSVIDCGEAAVEQLALSLDPFPRRPGAVLADAPEEGAAHPFAALAARRRPI